MEKPWGEKKEAVRSDVENEVVALYKERLKEMEIAFRYNLNLLADRDAELDIIEEQLRNGITQLERVTRDKAGCEGVLRQLHEEKKRNTRLLKKRLAERESAIKELERRNDGNLRSLKKAMDDVKREHQGEKQRLEKNFIRLIRLKESEHLEELRRVGKKHAEELDEATRERERFNAENRHLRKQLAEAEEKERSYIVRVQHLKRAYERTRGQTTMKVSKSTLTALAVVSAGTQTSNGGYAELIMLRKQNDVLKRIIKNLKRKTGEGGRDCQECGIVMEKIEETNRRFEAEIMEVKKEVERERTEEEAIIQSLERSVSCLKEKLLKGLAAGDNVLLLEDRLNQRLEKIDQKLERVKRMVDTGPCPVPLTKMDRNK